jgi:two-component system chemotaxis response regulator CheB
VKKLRVVVVDDSALAREMLRHILEADGDIEVVGEAADGRVAVETVARTRPELVTLDVEMPNMDGIAAVEQIMARCPVPILIITGRPPEQRRATLFEAVQRGALDLVEKPSILRDSSAAALRAHVRRLSSVAVVRHVAGGSPRRRTQPLGKDPALTLAGRPALRIIGIGASAGGPAAVAAVLRRFPRDLPASVAIVQHLLPGFAQSYTEFLRHQTEMRVELVHRVSPLKPGIVYVAPDDRHLVASRGENLVAVDTAPIGGYRPSATALFRSLAECFGPASAGVILSGIGDDGAAGLGELRAAGGLTLAQNEATSAVYGMPRAAIESGAASVAMSPVTVGDELVRAAFGRSGRPRP